MIKTKRTPASKEIYSTFDFLSVVFISSKWVFLALLCLSCEQPTKPKPPPNIILIMTDDQGWGDLSINGNQNIQTPNIDALAHNGVQFDRFYVSPVCSPTRAELLTGRYAVRGGVYSTSEGGERLDLDELTIADYLKKAGYATACYGKWHNGMQYPYHPNARGFDDFYGFCSGHWGNYIDPMLERNGEIVQGEGFIIDDFTNKGIEFIQQNRDQPFFLYLPYNTPHSPMQVPDDWWDKVKDRNLTSLHREADKEDITFSKAVLAFTENIDWNIGRIMKTLGQEELEENTIIIYLSDNGPNSNRWNGGMKGKKGSTDEGGVRSPFIVQWKGTLTAGSAVQEIASARDLLPTLTEIAGYSGAFTNTLDGQSLMPLLNREELKWPDRYIVSHWRNSTSIRSQHHRLDAQNQLFDIKTDGGQKTDLSKELPAVWEEMVKEKEKWEEEVLSELPQKDTRSFPVGHPNFLYTQLPARDAQFSGDIKRSNRWPNSSFLTNWTNEKDSIYWEVEVLEEATYEASIYYTCPKETLGSELQLSFLNEALNVEITEAFDSDFLGVELDRIPRAESFEKEYKILHLGKLKLKAGKGMISLKAPSIQGQQAIDFRLMMLKKAS